jgi:hypothetical protein
MDGSGHQLHTAAVYVIVGGAPIRASVVDAQFYVQWIDNLITRTSVGGSWASFFTAAGRTGAHARYQAARALFQQIAAEAAATPPVVTAFSPVSGATGVPVGTTVTATFSEALAPATVSGSTFELRDGTGALVPASVTWNAATTSAVLQPAAALAESTTHTATVKGGPAGVTDAGGTPMAADFTWSFTTAAPTPPDTTPPTVAATTPAAGATGVLVGASVSARFSEPLAPGTVSGTTVQLRDAGGQPVSAAVTWDAATTSAVVDPAASLAYSSAYTATIVGGGGGVTDVAGNPLAADHSWTFTTQAQPPSGPVSIWGPGDSPSLTNQTEGQAIEVGVKFRSSTAGYVTALRFYKGSLDGGSHVGHLWTATGTQLAAVTFTGETASGWQEVPLATPVAIAADTTYVASCHSSAGYYSATVGYFTQAVSNGPLTALADGTDGGNGVYRYGASAFPTGSWNASNYWVDVVFSAQPPGPDTTPPIVVATAPTSGATGVLAGANVTVTFSEALAPGTVNGTTVQLRDAASQPVSATVAWDAATRSAVLDPTSGLAYSSTYTATVKGGAAGVTDVAGNPLAADVGWSFSTEAPPPPPPNEGPGGPVLVIGSAANPFSRYYAEILRTEGLNAFTVADISTVDATVLAAYDVAILGEMPLSASHVAMLGDWVTAGGNLIAMRPDKQLAGLLGLADAGTTLANGYLAVNTASAPGAGIVAQTVQFHGTADRYGLAGATAVATLYSGPGTATTNPAVTLRAVGGNGGEAAAFAFDLARSIVYTRQGNPAWAGQKRDGQSGPIRSDDLFYPDWVDLDKVAIPQADEQQRLLANLVLHLARDRKPLPRFWYFPRGEKAVVVMTSDNHGSQNVEPRLSAEEAASAPGCSVDDWECIRSSVYLYVDGLPGDAAARSWEDKGFEIALHVNTGCANWTPASLAGDYSGQIAEFTSTFPSIEPLRTNRTHCIAWSDWATQPKVELQNGIRLDTNYYYWPPAWVANRPGFFTGSGMPMRFADTDGTMVDVYQATTQMTDESGQGYPFTIDTLLDRALGAEGYYGAFTTNIHTDGFSETEAAAIVASAKARSVPVVSAKQMLAWLDGRNGSSFEDIVWSAGTLTFGIAVGAGANGLQAMVPASAAGSPLVAVTRGGVAVPHAIQTLKGVAYAVFAAEPGTYQASYTIDTTPPVISSVSATPAANGTATVQWATDEPSTSLVQYGTAPASLTLSSSSALLLTAHDVTLTGLAANTTYYYRVTSADGAGNSASSTVSSFVTPDANTPPTVTLVAPNGGERLFTGNPYTIRWTASDDVGVTAIDVAASADGGTTFNPVAGCTGLPGTAVSCLWSSPGPATSQGRIRVTARDAAAQTGSATSAASFTVVSGTPSITLTAPVTAVTWNIATAQAITFNHNLGTGATVVVDLSRDAGASWTTINPAFVTTSASIGSFAWTVTGPATAQARVRVTYSGDTAVSSTSPASFTIADWIAVTAPNTAVTWTTGSTQSIAWNHSLGTSRTVNIDVSRDGGATWSAIAANVANATATTGSYSWVVSGPSTTQARVRVSASTSPAVADTSDVNFTISSGTVTVTAPNTAVTWATGSTRSITWSHTLGTSQTVNLDVSRDGGATWSPIATNVANATATTGSYSWVVSAPASTQARVRVSASADPAVGDTSNVNFTINGTVSMTAPTSGVRWAIGTPRTITWNHTLGAGQVFDILLSTDGGTTFPTTIASGVPGGATSGAYAWTVPGPVTTTARVRVQWVARPATRATSANFRMEDPTVTVTSPNTNVAWGIGSTRSLNFSHNLGVGQNVAIDVSRDGGATYSPITTFTTTSATSGSYSWVVTGPATIQARIRVTWTANATVTDVSNVNFRIQ